MILKFKEIFPDFKSFEDKILTPIKAKTGDMSWMDNSQKYYKMEMVYFILANQYNERFPYHDEKEFIGYFSNIFLTFTPTFYSRIANIVEDKLKDLQKNENVGVGTEVKSVSEGGEGITPESGIVNIHIDDSQYNVSQRSTSTYSQQVNNINLLDNAILLSHSKISGEVLKYVGCFNELFTIINLEDNMDYKLLKSLYDEMIQINASLQAQIDAFKLLIDKNTQDITTLQNTPVSVDVDDSQITLFEQEVLK